MNVKTIGQTKDGKDILTYTLETETGYRAEVSNYGANLMALWVPDKDGQAADVLLGYKDAEGLQTLSCFFGALVAPHANRIGQAAFELDGKRYELEKNDGEHNLHSGSVGLQHRIWEVSIAEGGQAVTFLIESPDGEDGFPGNRVTSVTYSLSEDGRLQIDYEGRGEGAVVFNPTNHAYFNLAGQGSGTILDHVLTIDADAFTWADAASIPDGRLVPVAGTPMDFRTPHRIGDRIDEPYEQLVWAKGYDHNWVLNKEPGKLAPCARLSDPASGRSMEVLTDMPGIQFYSGNYIEEEIEGKDGVHYAKRDGLCLETQYFPNALNVSSFAQPVIPSGQTAHSTTVYAFSAE